MPTDSLEWGLAGLIEEGGDVGRPIRSNSLSGPQEVALDGELLVWSFPRMVEVRTEDGFQRHPEEGEIKISEPPRDLLDRFVELAPEETPAKRYLEFARQYGVLGLCKHAPAPCTHHRLTNVESVNRWHVETCSATGREHIRHWRYWALRFRSCLNIAAALYQDQLPQLADAELLEENGPPVHPDLYDERSRKYSDLSKSESASLRRGMLIYHQDLLGAELDKLLALGAVGLSVSPSKLAIYFPHPPKSTSYRPASWDVLLSPMGSPNLFGHLTLQLMGAIVRTKGLGFCSSCGKAYTLSGRRPNPNRRSYCQFCRDRGAPMRDAKRDYRRREREKKSVS